MKELLGFSTFHTTKGEADHRRERERVREREMLTEVNGIRNSNQTNFDVGSSSLVRNFST